MVAATKNVIATAARTHGMGEHPGREDGLRARRSHHTTAPIMASAASHQADDGARAPRRRWYRPTR